MALDVPIPPWLHGPQTDPANAYLQAFHIGSQLSMEQARLQEAQVASQRDAQIRERALEANLERAKQEIANRAAYQSASLGIRQQAVDSALQRTSQVAAREAARFAANERLTQGLQSGKYKTFQEALYDNPDLMTAGAIPTLIKAGQQQGKYHFGTGGLVQRINPETGKVETLNPATPPSNRSLSIARVRTAGQIPGMQKALEDLEPGSAAYNSQLKAIQEAKDFLQNNPIGAAAPVVGAATVATPAAGAVDVGTKFPENSILKHKDGSRWIVQGGKAVPYGEPVAAAAAPVSTMFPQGGVDESAALLPSEQEEIDTAPPTDEELTD